METEAERNIGFVILILRYIGWPFAVLFVGMTVLGVVLAISVIFQGGSIGKGILVAIMFVPFAAFSLWLLKLATRMTQRDLTAKFPAINVSSLLLLGFPLFTIVGIMCLYKIRRFYDTYCAEQLATR